MNSIISPEVTVPPSPPQGPAWLEATGGYGYATEEEAVAAIDAPPPAYTPLGPAWLEATGFGTAEAVPPPVWRQGSLGESGPFIGLGYGYTIELAKRIAAAAAGAGAGAAAGAFALKYIMLREMPDEPDALDYTDAEIIDGMAWYSWDAERTRVWIQLLLGDALADEGIAMGLLRALLDTPAADDALRPAVATLVRRLRILEGV